MKPIDAIFEICLENSVFKIQTMYLPRQVLFKIHFPDERESLVIGRVNNAKSEKFWTSIPEGRFM